MGYGSRYNDQILDFLNENPNLVNQPHIEIARAFGLDDSRPIKRFFRNNPNFVEKMKSGKSTTEWEDTNYTSSGNKHKPPKTRDYKDGDMPKGREKLKFAEYCKLYDIDIEKATSAKFINHNGQEAWNVFVDLTKISQTHLDNYFGRLKTELSKAINPVKINKIPESHLEKAYIFWFSDKHVGAHTNEKAMFGNPYSIEIFKERMLESLDDYQLAMETHGRFDKVIVADLGDALDGWDAATTRKNSSHVLPQNANNRESFDAYAGVMIEFMDQLVQLDGSNSYQYVAVTNDNHSSDFGYISNRAVEIWLNVKYPEIETNINERFIDHFKYGVHTFMLSHGKDSEHKKHGMPLNLDAKTESYINSYIDEYDLRGILHFIKGDLHQASTNYGRKFRYRNVWSMYGSSDWSQTNFGPNPAGVSTEIVYKNINKVLQDEYLFVD